MLVPNEPPEAPEWECCPRPNPCEPCEAKAAPDVPPNVILGTE